MASIRPLDWSQLISDVLSLVYERLSFADLARAKSVCSAWYSVSTPRKNHVPWLIFKQDEKWRLFDPEEGKFYKAQINHFGFGDCRILATCGNWVLVLEDLANLYISNAFTSKIISLPPLEYEHDGNKILGKYSIHFDYGFAKGRRCQDCGKRRYRKTPLVQVKNAVLWVDERSKDYLVVWTSNDNNQLYFCMKGDIEWFRISSCQYLGEAEEGDWDMAYKDKKLYILYQYGIRILDFSEGFPREVPNHPYVNRPFNTNRYWSKTKMKLTTSGDIVLMSKWYKGSEWYESFILFSLYKMNYTSKKWEIANSMEEEAFVWDLSDTLPTKGQLGIKKDMVYFCDKYRGGFATYDIPTRKIDRFEQYSHLPGVKKDARWFLPLFGVANTVWGYDTF